MKKHLHEQLYQNMQNFGLLNQNLRFYGDFTVFEHKKMKKHENINNFTNFKAILVIYPSKAIPEDPRTRI